MQGEKGELWRKLCEQAAVEQDPEKLLELTKEITRLLDEKDARLRQSRAKQHTVVTRPPSPEEKSVGESVG